MRREDRDWIEGVIKQLPEPTPEQQRADARDAKRRQREARQERWRQSQVFAKTLCSFVAAVITRHNELLDGSGSYVLSTGESEFRPWDGGIPWRIELQFNQEGQPVSLMLDGDCYLLQATPAALRDLFDVARAGGTKLEVEIPPELRVPHEARYRGQQFVRFIGSADMHGMAVRPPRRTRKAKEQQR